MLTQQGEACCSMPCIALQQFPLQWQQPHSLFILGVKQDSLLVFAQVFPLIDWISDTCPQVCTDLQSPFKVFWESRCSATYAAVLYMLDYHFPAIVGMCIWAMFEKMRMWALPVILHRLGSSLLDSKHLPQHFDCSWHSKAAAKNEVFLSWVMLAEDWHIQVEFWPPIAWVSGAWSFRLKPDVLQVLVPLGCLAQGSTAP